MSDNDGVVVSLFSEFGWKIGIAAHVKGTNSICLSQVTYRLKECPHLKIFDEPSFAATMRTLFSLKPDEVMYSNFIFKNSLQILIQKKFKESSFSEKVSQNLCRWFLSFASWRTNFQIALYVQYLTTIIIRVIPVVQILSLISQGKEDLKRLGSRSFLDSETASMPLAITALSCLISCVQSMMFVRFNAKLSSGQFGRTLCVQEHGCRVPVSHHLFSF